MKDALLVFALLLLVLLVGRDYLTSKTTYECHGVLTREGVKEAATVHMRLELYRWWLSLLRKNEGELVVEVPRLTTYHFDRIRDGDTQIRIFNHGHFKGVFSTISRTLTISIAADFFDGSCTVSNQPNAWQRLWSKYSLSFEQNS